MSVKKISPAAAPIMLPKIGASQSRTPALRTVLPRP
jgi:hypothetical protein